MPNKYDLDEAEVYFDEFDYSAHKETFDRSVDDLSDYIDRCENSTRIKTCQWEGQNPELTKTGDNAFPFKGGADSQVWLSHGLMATGTAINMNALRRSQIQAYPRKATDVERASQVSVFLKYLRDSGIENFWREAELSDNFYKGKALMVTYHGYQAPRLVPHLKKFEIEDVLETVPELADILTDKERDEEAFDILNSVDGWELNKGRVKKALKQFRETGVAEIPVLIEDEGRAEVCTLDPETEFYAPLATQNFQDINRCWVRKPMTPQEILARVESEGWDEAWADYAVEFMRGNTKAGTYYRNHAYAAYGQEYRDLIDVVFSYEKLIDKTDGAQGIYLTIWSPEFGDSPDDTPSYAKRTLLPGLTKFPFTVTAPYEAKTLYSGATWPELLKSPQKSKKVFRDSNTDESSYSISPSLLTSHSWDYGRPQPGAVYPALRPGQSEPRFLERAERSGNMLQLEEAVTKEAMDLVGLDPDSPYSAQRQQDNINRFLGHWGKVLLGVYEAYKLNGPDELYLRVTGNPQPIEFVKDEDEAEMHVAVSFNAIYDDPEQLKELRETIMATAQLDPNGRINMEAGVDMILNMTDPMLADVLLLPTEQGQNKVIAETTDDISKMAAGVPVGAPQNAAQLRLSTIQNYAQSPTGAAKLAQDQGFQFLLSEYVKQLEFQVSQQKNAEIGRIGTSPAQMGNINTQNLENV